MSGFVPDFYTQGASAAAGAAISAAKASAAFVAENTSAPYTAEGIWTTFYQDDGVALLPVAKQNADGSALAASIVGLSSPYGMKVVQWFLRRRGDKPTIPDPEPDNENTVRARTSITFRSAYPDPSDGLTPVLEASGYYVYLLRKPLTIKDGVFHIGSSPCFTLDAAQSSYDGEDFSGDILTTGGDDGMA